MTFSAVGTVARAVNSEVKMPRLLITSAAVDLLCCQIEMLPKDPNTYPGVGLTSTDGGNTFHPSLFFTDDPSNYRKYCLRVLRGITVILDLMDTPLEEGETCRLSVSNENVMQFERHLHLREGASLGQGTIEFIWSREDP